MMMSIICMLLAVNGLADRDLYVCAMWICIKGPRFFHPVRSGLTCHLLDIFSRWKRARLYRNLIKIGR
jgi:hypothetical protein